MRNPQALHGSPIRFSPHPFNLSALRVRGRERHTGRSVATFVRRKQAICFHSSGRRNCHQLARNRKMFGHCDRSRPLRTTHCETVHKHLQLFSALLQVIVLTEFSDYVLGSTGEGARPIQCCRQRCSGLDPLRYLRDVRSMFLYPLAKATSLSARPHFPNLMFWPTALYSHSTPSSSCCPKCLSLPRPKHLTWVRSAAVQHLPPPTHRSVPPRDRRGATYTCRQRFRPLDPRSTVHLGTAASEKPVNCGNSLGEMNHGAVDGKYRRDTCVRFPYSRVRQDTTDTTTVRGRSGDNCWVSTERLRLEGG